MRYILIFCCYSLINWLIDTKSLQGQKVLLGAETIENNGKLENTDAMLDQTRYYKNTKVDLKAGEGIFLYMLASEFEPQILTIDTMLAEWKSGSNEEYGLDAYLSFISVVAIRDTSFHVIYSSLDTFITGNFVFGGRKLKAEQMVYNVSADYCNRLTYLINNWQCYWQLIPLYEDIEEIWVEEKTANSLMPGGMGFLDEYGLTDYHETIFESDTEGKAKLYYEEMVINTTACLNTDQWDIKTYEIMNDDAMVYSTDYIIKGGMVNQEGYSFSIEFIDNETDNDQVSIIFY